MEPFVVVCIIISAFCVFAIAVITIGREARRLDAVAPRVVYQIEQAVEFVAELLPLETQGHLTVAELGELLLAHLTWLHDRGLLPLDVIDRPQDISEQIISDGTTVAAYLLGSASTRGVELLDDVDVIHVVDAHMAYFVAIGAVGPRAINEP